MIVWIDTLRNACIISSLNCKIIHLCLNNAHAKCDTSTVIWILKSEKLENIQFFKEFWYIVYRNLLHLLRDCVMNVLLPFAFSRWSEKYSYFLVRGSLCDTEHTWRILEAVESTQRHGIACWDNRNELFLL